VSEVEQPFATNIAATDEFLQIREVVLSALAGRSMGPLGSEDLRDRLPRSQVDLRSDTGLMLRVESLISELLKKLSLANCKALQFPVNVRVMSHKTPNQRVVAKGAYSTELLHCDAWSGAPSDSRNHLIYLYTEPSCPYLEMYETLDESDPLRGYVGNYTELSDQLYERRRVAIPCEAGILAVWPTYSPHRTVVPAPSTSRAEGSPLRISIDFRTRESTPYEEDRNSAMDTFSDSKMNSLGVYWTFPSVSASMKDKIELEIKSARESGSVAEARRREYIRKYYPDAAVSGL